MGIRIHYPEETKWKAIEMKQAGYTNQEIYGDVRDKK
jgi:transposase